MGFYFQLMSASFYRFWIGCSTQRHQLEEIGFSQIKFMLLPTYLVNASSEWLFAGYLDVKVPYKTAQGDFIS